MITSTPKVEGVLELITQKIPEVVGVDAVTIRLLDPTGKKLILLAAHGLSREYLDRGPVDAEKSVMEALAEQCGIAIENARIYGDQQRQIQYFKTLDKIGKALNSTLKLQEVLVLIVTRLPEVMALKGCTIRLLESGKVHLDFMAASGLSQEYLRRGSIDDELSTHQASLWSSMMQHRIQVTIGNENRPEPKGH